MRLFSKLIYILENDVPVIPVHKTIPLLDFPHIPFPLLSSSQTVLLSVQYSKVPSHLPWHSLPGCHHLGLHEILPYFPVRFWTSQSRNHSIYLFYFIWHVEGEIQGGGQTHKRGLFLPFLILFSLWKIWRLTVQS